MSRFSAWRDRLRDISAAGRTRRTQCIQPTGPVEALLDTRQVILACTNDYLGLAWDPDVRSAAHAGGGSGASRLISGTRPIHVALEEELERIHGRPALLFPSGYQANLAVFSTVCQERDLMASDARNHASIIDGMRLSKAKRTIVPHGSPEAIPEDVDLIALEGLYSMDGDTPPFADYPSTPWMAVDEAHSVGCMGPDGRGACAMAGITPDILIGTFGKAYGAAGAFVIGPPELKDLLINAGRSFIFTTAPPEPVTSMALAGLTRATRDHGLRERLVTNTHRLREGLRQLGWSPLGHAHIVPVVVGERALDLASKLLDRGVYAPAIRYPTVPAGAERIRFTVSAAHTQQHIDRILDAMGPAPVGE